MGSQELLSWWKCGDAGRAVPEEGREAPHSFCRPCPVHLFYPDIHLSPVAAAKLLQSCTTLCVPIDSTPPGSAVPGILQARTLEWVAISFSKSTSYIRSFYNKLVTLSKLFLCSVRHSSWWIELEEGVHGRYSGIYPIKINVLEYQVYVQCWIL